MFFIKAYADENWVTINGVHVLIGADGKISKGPANLLGKEYKGQKTGLTGSQLTAYNKARKNGVPAEEAREHALTYKGASTKKSSSTKNRVIRQILRVSLILLVLVLFIRKESTPSLFLFIKSGAFLILVHKRWLKMLQYNYLN